MKSGEIQKRNLSLQVGFSLQYQSMVVLCLAEESTQAMAYVCILGRNMQKNEMEKYHGLRSYCAPPPPKLKKGKSSNNGSTSKCWSMNDPEFQRKKRIASYKVYSVEGKVKGSLRRSFRWLKDKYSQVGWHDSESLVGNHPSFTKKKADLFFPPDFADDFPDAMQVCLLDALLSDSVPDSINVIFTESVQLMPCCDECCTSAISSFSLARTPGRWSVESTLGEPQQPADSYSKAHHRRIPALHSKVPCMPSYSPFLEDWSRALSLLSPGRPIKCTSLTLSSHLPRKATWNQEIPIVNSRNTWRERFEAESRPLGRGRIVYGVAQPLRKLAQSEYQIHATHSGLVQHLGLEYSQMGLKWTPEISFYKELDALTQPSLLCCEPAEQRAMKMSNEMSPQYSSLLRSIPAGSVYQFKPGRSPLTTGSERTFVQLVKPELATLRVRFPNRSIGLSLRMDLPSWKAIFVEWWNLDKELKARYRCSVIISACYSPVAELRHSDLMSTPEEGGLHLLDLKLLITKENSIIHYQIDPIACNFADHPRASSLLHKDESPNDLTYAELSALDDKSFICGTLTPGRDWISSFVPRSRRSQKPCPSFVRLSLTCLFSEHFPRAITWENYHRAANNSRPVKE
nr:hypothetical protein DM860_000665 [Ipomoea batatas]